MTLVRIDRFAHVVIVSRFRRSCFFRTSSGLGRCLDLLVLITFMAFVTMGKGPRAEAKHE